MRNMVLTAWISLTAVAASAEGLPQAMGNDLLTKQILSKAAQENGGVTAAVRLGTGQTIELKLADISSAPAAAPALAAPAASLALAPAEGLAAKSEKPKARKRSRDAAAQLKHVSSKAGKSWGEKR